MHRYAFWTLRQKFCVFTRDTIATKPCFLESSKNGKITLTIKMFYFKTPYMISSLHLTYPRTNRFGSVWAGYKLSCPKIFWKDILYIVYKSLEWAEIISFEWTMVKFAVSAFWKILNRLPDDQSTRKSYINLYHQIICWEYIFLYGNIIGNRNLKSEIHRKKRKM